MIRNGEEKRVSYVDVPATNLDQKEITVMDAISNTGSDYEGLRGITHGFFDRSVTDSDYYPKLKKYYCKKSNCIFWPPCYHDSLTVFLIGFLHV